MADENHAVNLDESLSAVELAAKAISNGELAAAVRLIARVRRMAGGYAQVAAALDALEKQVAAAQQAKLAQEEKAKEAMEACNPEDVADLQRILAAHANLDIMLLPPRRQGFYSDKELSTAYLSLANRQAISRHRPVPQMHPRLPLRVHIPPRLPPRLHRRRRCHQRPRPRRGSRHSQAISRHRPVTQMHPRLPPRLHMAPRLPPRLHRRRRCHHLQVRRHTQGHRCSPKNSHSCFLHPCHLLNTSQCFRLVCVP